MTTDFTPPDQPAAGTPDLPPQGEGTKRKRPVGWMILAGVAIAAAIGLGVWALLLNDDLNDTEQQLKARTRCSQSAASAEAESRIADARMRIDAALADVAGVVVVSDEDGRRRSKPPPKPSRAWQTRKRRWTRRKAKSSRRAPSAN